MWDYVSCVKATTIDTKTDDYATVLEIWKREADNSKIITWINNSITHSIDAQLAKYDTPKEICDHLSSRSPKDDIFLPSWSAHGDRPWVRCSSPSKRWQHEKE